MKALRNALIAVSILLALVLGAAIGGFVWFKSSHIKVNGAVYDLDTTLVDLRGQETSVSEYRAVQKALPGAVVRWDVPFHGQRYPDDTKEIVLTSFSAEDIEGLAYFPELEHVDATQCRDYGALTELEQQRPELQVDFRIHLGDQTLERTVESLTIEKDTVTGEELAAALPYMPQLASVVFNDPSIPAQDLYAMGEQFPDVAMTWTKEFMGKTYDTSLTELDISNTEPESLQYVEDTMAYFPNLTRLVMDKCGFENEDMAAFRDRVRDHYKVVWGVKVGEAYLMTDETKFMPGQANKRVRDADMYNMRYCEDMIAVDVGHLNISNLEWVVGTPHLKYLIVGDANVYDENLKPISCLKELEWLELFNTPVKDVSPLIGCTGLRDLLLSKSYINVEPLGQMPWLENIWLLSSGIDGEDITYLTEHLPNTHLEVAVTNHAHSHGWRKLPRYFEMRDALGMWYMDG